jgi:ubiquinone/menaquinone biosynthesis C-methylase UbiE
MRDSTDFKSLSQERYTRFAEGYVTSGTHAKGQELDRLVEIAQPKADWEVLDVATGGGHTALKFAPHVFHVIATDITPRMLEQADAHIARMGINNVTFEPADAEALPFGIGTFDLVTCRIAPHHFPNPLRFLRESARVLKSGGLLLVQDHALPEDEKAARYIDSLERVRDPSHRRAFSESEWVSMFRTAGLGVEHTEQITKAHRLVPWAERQGCTPQVVQKLVTMVEDAPDAVLAWMQPSDFGTPNARFINHHLIIAGRKH